jgi:hypothetical protein
MDEKNKFFKVNRLQLVLYALLAVLMIASIYMAGKGNVPDWSKCKESLFTQMFSDTCTPSRSAPPGTDNLPLPNIPL